VDPELPLAVQVEDKSHGISGRICVCTVSVIPYTFHPVLCMNCSISQTSVLVGTLKNIAMLQGIPNRVLLCNIVHMSLHNYSVLFLIYYYTVSAYELFEVTYALQF
jgi:hypothetical protein